MIVLTHAKLLWLCQCPQPENRQHGFNGLVGSFRWGKFPRTDLLPSCYPQSILAGERTERLLLQQFAFSLCRFWVRFALSIALRHGSNVVRALGGSLREIQHPRKFRAIHGIAPNITPNSQANMYVEDSTTYNILKLLSLPHLPLAAVNWGSLKNWKLISVPASSHIYSSVTSPWTGLPIYKLVFCLYSS